MGLLLMILIIVISTHFFAEFMATTTINENSTALCSGRYLVDSNTIEYDEKLIYKIGWGDVPTFWSYMFISVFFIYVFYKRDDVLGLALMIVVMFAAFIFACGGGHLLDYLNIRFHEYNMKAAWGVFTSVVSVATAVVFYWNLDNIINFPSFQMIKKALKLIRENHELQLSLTKCQIKMELLEEKLKDYEYNNNINNDS